MEMRYEKEASDVRGSVIFMSYGDKKVNLVEIKSGFSRGGHYHDFASSHHIISGKIEYREKDIDSGTEKILTVSAPATISVPPRTAHLLTAIEDTLFAEAFETDYSATEYPEYRKIVTEKMK